MLTFTSIKVESLPLHRIQLNDGLGTPSAEQLNTRSVIAGTTRSLGDAVMLGLTDGGEMNQVVLNRFTYFVQPV